MRDVVYPNRKSDEHVSKALSSAATFLGRLDLGLSSDVDVEDLVRHAHGALRTNAIGFHGLSSSALYPLVAKASHSCLPNMEPLPQVGRRFGFAAKTRIEEGEELTIRYRFDIYFFFGRRLFFLLRLTVFFAVSLLQSMILTLLLLQMLLQKKVFLLHLRVSYGNPFFQRYDIPPLGASF